MKIEISYRLKGYYTAIIVCILANLTHYFSGNKLADFTQACSFGLAAGSLLVTFSWGVQWKRKKEAQAMV